MDPLLIIGAAFVYLLLAGAGYNIAEFAHRQNCGKCDEEMRGRIGSYHDPEIGWFFAGLFWLPLLPIAAGLYATRNGFPTKEARRARQLAEKEHQVQLAALERKRLNYDVEEF